MARRSSQQPDWGDTAWRAPVPSRRDSRWDAQPAKRDRRDEPTRNFNPEPRDDDASRVVSLDLGREKPVYPRAAGRQMTTGPKDRTRVADPNDRTQLAAAAEILVAPQPRARNVSPPPPPPEALLEARARSRNRAEPSVSARARSAAPRDDLVVEEWEEQTSVRERPPVPPESAARRVSQSLSNWFRPETGAQPTFLGSDPSEGSSLVEWLGIEDEVTDNDHGMLPPMVEGRLERAQRRAEQGRAVQMEIELQEAVRAARQYKARIPKSRLEAIEIPCYRLAAEGCLARAKRHAKAGEVMATQNSILSARHYAAMAGAVVDAKAVRRILRKANLRAFSEHLAAAKRHAAFGNLPLTKMAVALARTCLAAAVENGARRRSVDPLEALKVQARLNAIRNQRRLAPSG